MPTSVEALPAHWQFYAEQATITHKRRSNARTMGHEEMLDAILDKIQAGATFDDDLKAQLLRLPQNRMKKHIRLRKQLAERPGVVLPTLDAEVRDEVARAERTMTPAEYRVEQRLAVGESYEEIARAEQVSVTTLKMRVSRCRQRVRVSRGA